MNTTRKKTTKKITAPLTDDEINDEIRRLNDDVRLGYADRISELNRLLARWPKADLPEAYETLEVILPGGPLRVISVSGEAVKQNSAEKDLEKHRPVINIFAVPASGLIADAAPMWFPRDRRYPTPETQEVRHVQILGPSEVIHDPSQPVHGLARRSCVMRSSAPLRVYIDTYYQHTLYPWNPPLGC